MKNDTTMEQGRTRQELADSHKIMAYTLIAGFILMIGAAIL